MKQNLHIYTNKKRQGMIEAEHLDIILIREGMVKIYILFPLFQKYFYKFVTITIVATNFNFYLECIYWYVEILEVVIMNTYK